MTDVSSIVIEYLKAKGYDGLWSPDAECACEVADLMPCEEIGIGGCEPGYKIKCGGDDCIAGGDCGKWHISREPAPTPDATGEPEGPSWRPEPFETVDEAGNRVNVRVWECPHPCRKSHTEDVEACYACGGKRPGEPDNEKEDN